MPEGDTIHRTARTLETVLVSKEVTAVETRRAELRALGVQRLLGQTVAVVEARGKHLLVWFEPSVLALHTHMMMSGSWHTYRPGQRWQKPAHLATVALRVADAVAVCFSAPVCELLAEDQVARHRSLSALGPDPLGDGGSDLAEASRRLEGAADRPIGEALLDQRVLAGVGNVYRCEVLFLHGVDPWSRTGDLPAEVRAGLLDTAGALLRRNTAPEAGPRTTTAAASRSSARHYVYGRARRPCLRCATPIRAARLGEQARTVYWCPDCQPSTVAPRRESTV